MKINRLNRLQQELYPKNFPRGAKPAKTDNGTPMYPGYQFGATMDEVREFVKSQKRVKGFTFTAGTGNTRVDLQLSGSARLFLGLALLTDETQPAGGQPDSIELTINNEIVIEQLPPLFLSPDFCDDEFYFIPRPLSGTDQVFVETVNSNAAQDVYLAVYYL